MIVRLATHADVWQLVSLGVQNHFESHFRALPFVPEKVEAYLHQFIDKDDCLAIVATNAKDEIVGYMGAYLAPYFFNDELQASDLLLYVAPAHRGSSAAVRLIRTYVKWAKEKGAKEATLALRANIKVERTGRFYEKLGFEQSVPHYVMRF